MWAVVGSALRLHAVMVPFSDAKMNVALAATLRSALWAMNAPVLKTCPVGAPPSIFTALMLPGKVTFKPGTCSEYSVVESELLSDTHSGLVSPADMPQAFCSASSWNVAGIPGRLETRLVWTNAASSAPADVATAAVVRPPARASTAPTAAVRRESGRRRGASLRG